MGTQRGRRIKVPLSLFALWYFEQIVEEPIVYVERSDTQTL